MKVAVFDTHKFEKPVFLSLNSKFNHELTYFEPRLTEDTVSLARGFEAVCAFTNDVLDAQIIAKLKEAGVRLVALRSAGYNHVDVSAALRTGITLMRVPAYSPYSVAEHATALILALDRKICRAAARVRELNFSLDGLIGFDLHDKTVGIVGTGRIGSVMAKIMTGFGCHVLAFDQNPDALLTANSGVQYVPFVELCGRADIVSLHVPLTPLSRHLIGREALALMKPGVMLINTGRGALIDTKALIDALKTGHVGAAGLDVYEEEESVFSRDLSDAVLQDDVLARLMTFPNVLITAHQGFLTHEAIHNIAETTLKNISDFAAGLRSKNEIRN